jgi:hypothetical protein
LTRRLRLHISTDASDALVSAGKVPAPILGSCSATTGGRGRPRPSVSRGAGGVDTDAAKAATAAAAAMSKAQYDQYDQYGMRPLTTDAAKICDLV